MSRTVARPLSVCLLPTEKLVPLLIADQDGLFAANGLDVQVTLVGSAAERDALLLAGAADVALLNLVSVVLLSLAGHALRTLTIVERATRERPMFKLLRSPAWRADGGRRLGIAPGTIVEYLADAMLAAVDLGRVDRVEANDIPTRARDILNGTLDYAVLAEPAASDCETRGAVAISDDRVTEAPPPTLCTAAATARERADDLATFIATYTRAAALVNADERRARAAFVALGLPHDPGWAAPHFPAGEQPSVDEVARVLGWATRRARAGATTASAQELAARLIA